MISPRVFTGGDLATNGYLLECREGLICFDAPEGMAREAFYRPRDRGFERELARRLAHWAELRAKRGD